ncbi:MULTISPECIES: ABC transporter permease [Streptomyces]|uniref:ABC transporter permease n=1 Tax=Streptomyces lycopersici TaxID=2974589 RepID=UPI0021CF6765|nr:ABC transporter permease [Streptomyces sp. NEAU-383]
MSPATGTTTATTDPAVPGSTAGAAPGTMAEAAPEPRTTAGPTAPREAPHRVAPLTTAARTAARRLPGLLLRALTKVAAIAALLAVWEIAPRVGLVDRTFLPPFSEVARAWWELLADGQLTDNAEASLVRSFTGFGLAVAIGVPLGLLIGRYRLVADLLGPLLEVFRNTAALALLPVFVLLLGIGETSKISIVLYACTWPILLNTISAVRNVDPTLLKLARSMDLSALRLFQKVILPASVPTIFTGIRLAGASSILVLVAAEMVGAKEGLGYLINTSQYNFAIPRMYAGILTISVIGVAFNQLLVTVERRLSSWHVPAPN